jgi:ribonuclease HI
MTFRFRSDEMYTDGGVVGHNPSKWGGTWAYRILHDGLVVAERSGFITPRQAQVPAVTNNLTEMLAVVRAMDDVPNDWMGMVLSDSQITLGRLFLGWKWKNIPDWLVNEFARMKIWHDHFAKWEHALLQGHPTKNELLIGKGSRGYPVSEHNVWCDKACGERASKWLEEHDPF